MQRYLNLNDKNASGGLISRAVTERIDLLPTMLNYDSVVVPMDDTTSLVRFEWEEELSASLIFDVLIPFTSRMREERYLP